MFSDRTLLDLSSKMTEPLCEGYRYLRYGLVTPLEFCDSLTNEIARRALICIGGLIASTLIYAYPIPMIAGVAFVGLSGKLLRALGFALQNNGFTHVLGQTHEKNLTASLRCRNNIKNWETDKKAPQDFHTEKATLAELQGSSENENFEGKPTQPETDSERYFGIKLMSWNICGLAGGFSLDHGGVLPWKERFDAIIKTIKTEDPDVLILQEIVDTDLAESIIEHLKTNYAHFFIHLGSSIWGVGSGCMVLSKCAIHDFSFHSFTNRDWTLHRGFASLEVKARPDDEKPCLRILGTHLLHGRPEVAHKNRMEQVAQMLDFVAKRTFSIPTIIAGDFNIERDKEDGLELKNLLHHGYVGHEPTCTDQFLAKWSQEAAIQFPEETVDYISSVKSQPPVILQNVRVVQAFEDNVRTARSDHHALTAEIIIYSH